MPLWFTEFADRVHLVLDDFDASRELSGEVLERMASVHRVTSFDSIESVTAVVADLRERGITIDVVASFTEFSQIAAAYMAQLLGVKHQSLLMAAATRDKRLMKRLAKDAGIDCANYRSVPGVDVEDLDRRLEGLTFPVVIKPAAGMSTMATSQAENQEDAVRKIKGMSIPPQFGSKQLIVEEFISGTEYFVDAVWRDGLEVHFSIARYFAPRLQAGSPDVVNGNYTVPETDFPEFYERVRSFHADVNRAFDLTNGASHFEFFDVPGRGLVFSELATRLGGGGSPPMVRGAFGIDTRQVWAAQQTHSWDRLPARRSSRYKVAGWFNVEPTQAGYISSLPDIHEILSEEHVLEASVMTEIGRYHSKSHPSEWGVFVVIGASDEEELVRRFQFLAQKYPLEVSAEITM